MALLPALLERPPREGRGRGDPEGLDLLEEHLQVQWLRPESALWDAIASRIIAAEGAFESPSLDLGSGNGIFSFITAGGSFSPTYDGYRNADPSEERDLYDCFFAGPGPNSVVRPPRYRIDCAVDAKMNLLRQAEGLGFYRRRIAADANRPLPFEEGTFQTVFSNMVCWLDSAKLALKEIRRILRSGGRVWLCLPTPKFREYCASFRWKEEGSELLRLLNRGRSESIRWMIGGRELEALARALRFRVVRRSTYLSPLTLRTWDVGLRCLSPMLLRMVSKLGEDDRLSIKREWIETVHPFLRELYRMDQASRAEGGYQWVGLEKR